MKRQWSGRGVFFCIGMCIALAMATAAPAHAQVGSLQGRVFDESGKPVPDAEVTLEWTGDTKIVFTAKTDNNGRWLQSGLKSAGGRWNITVRKGDLVGFVYNAEAPLRAVNVVEDIVLRMSAEAKAREAAAAAEEERLALNKLLQEVVAALDANDHDLAITKLNEAAARIPNCFPCYVQLGNVHRAKKDFDQAEAAFKKALEINAEGAEAYGGLAAVYRAQNRMDLAAEANAKADALYGKPGSGTDAISLYNAGVTALTAGDVTEAKNQFQRAIQLDPKMADAHFELAQALIREGTAESLEQALQPLKEYLALAPEGANAEIAKALIDEIPGMVKTMKQ
jgi:tetratricopeptide (TPR) repeat protein